jgi:GNAT superfamily N-acetyltransferase
MSISIRPATVADAEAIADVQVRGRRAGYAAFFPAGYLAGLTVEYAAGLWRERLPDSRHKAIVAECDGGVVGYAWYYLGDADGAACELSQLFVLPEAWSQGIGSALLLAAERALAAEGFATGRLWVYELNARARPFYEKRGWWFDGTTDLMQRGDSQLVHMRYAKSLVAEDQS